MSPPPREILVLKRATGYLRLHVPPLLYAPVLGVRLPKALTQLPGVRKVVFSRKRARISVFYDPWVTDDRPMLLEVDRQASPLLERMETEPFQEKLQEHRSERLQAIGRKATRSAYSAAVLYLHLYLLRRWMRYPVRYWWAWGLIAYGVYTHKKPIKQIPELPK